MSTRGNICIKLNDEDLDKDFHMKDENGNDIAFTVHTKSGFPYMFVYNHHDSYVSGLGKKLIDNLQTYEEVRDYILQGNRTSFDTPYIAGPNAEEPEDNQPKMCADISGEIPNEYFYLFEDGFWKVKTLDESLSGKQFKKLPNQNRIKIELNEKEIEAFKWILDKYLKIHEIIVDIPDGHHEIIMARVRDINKKIRNVKNES